MISIVAYATILQHRNQRILPSLWTYRKLNRGMYYEVDTVNTFLPRKIGD